jgi:hypothetical protein
MRGLRDVLIERHQPERKETFTSQLLSVIDGADVSDYYRLYISNGTQTIAYAKRSGQE